MACSTVELFSSENRSAKPPRSSITRVRLSVKAPIDSATEDLINWLTEGLIAVPEPSLTVTVETEDPCSYSLGVAMAKTKLWVVGVRRHEG